MIFKENEFSVTDVRFLNNSKFHEESEMSGSFFFGLGSFVRSLSDSCAKKPFISDSFCKEIRFNHLELSQRQ